MRKELGKLITVGNAIFHGAGSSLLADGIGIVLQAITRKKVLIVNVCGQYSFLERYVEKDLEVRYTMHDLEAYGEKISPENIETYATPISDKLYMIAGSRIETGQRCLNMKFINSFLQGCLKAFDIVVADIPSGFNAEVEQLSQMSDLNLAIVKPSKIVFDDLFEKSENISVRYNESFRKRLQSEKTMTIVNCIPPQWNAEKTAKQIEKRYKLPMVFGVYYDGEILNISSYEKKMYSFLMNDLQAQKSMFSVQIVELALLISALLNLKTEEVEKIPWYTRFKKIVSA